ncbi:hypothetical protein [Candidatus Laterigemmans baculatus]|uniref:hypothetical protein n=1 Tax=Candidatus Laterigemmans baculatus TaxID=2770505 RepID=UPI0013DBE6EB|nr:hypothetical protein [Candidatus Laterigemmans baculatus]
MYRVIPVLLLAVGLIVGKSLGDQTNPDPTSPAAIAHCGSDTSTLRLYFAPDAVSTQRGQAEFKPEVARLFVDDLFVGNAIVNLQGQLPTLRFSAGPHTIRVELNDRVFQSKITFLGKGSTQILFIDFDTPIAKPEL